MFALHSVSAGRSEDVGSIAGRSPDWEVIKIDRLELEAFSVFRFPSSSSSLERSRPSDFSVAT
jgi:hypothetical protein